MAAKITFVVAVAENGVIGKDGKLPWRIAADMAHFKELTMGKPIIMGRKTWDGLPKKPLPGRPNIVITRDTTFSEEGAEATRSVREAWSIAKIYAEQLEVDEIAVIGGAQIYNAMLPFVEVIYLTEVHMSPEGDAHFEFDRGQWKETSRVRHSAGEKDSADYSFVLLERI